MSVQTIHFLRPQPLRKEYTSTFFECQNPHENNKNQAKKLRVYGNNVDFQRPPSPRKCMVCTLMKMLTFIDGPLYSYILYSDFTKGSDEHLRYQDK